MPLILGLIMTINCIPLVMYCWQGDCGMNAESDVDLILLATTDRC